MSQIQALSTGGGNGGTARVWTHVETFTISSDTTIDFTSLSENLYAFVFRDVLWGDTFSNDRRLYVRISDDNGATWKSGAADYAFAYTGRLITGSVTGQSTGAAQIETGGSSANTTNTSETSYGEIYIQNSNNASRKPLVFGNFFGGDGDHTLFSGKYNTAAAVNGIRFLINVGSFISGTVDQYYITEG